MSLRKGALAADRYTQSLNNLAAAGAAAKQAFATRAEQPQQPGGGGIAAGKSVRQDVRVTPVDSGLKGMRLRGILK